MSKKEGDILRFYLKSNGIGIGDFASKVGFSSRSALYYQLDKEFLDYDFKQSAAAALGVRVEEIWNTEHLSENISTLDSEKETLKKLVAAQEEIIRNHKVFVTAQLIRGEAYAAETLSQVAELRGRVEKLGKSEIDAIKKKYEEGVEGRIQRIRTDLGL